MRITEAVCFLPLKRAEVYTNLSPLILGTSTDDTILAIALADGVDSFFSFSASFIC